jgi:hypothetical protein
MSGLVNLACPLRLCAGGLYEGITVAHFDKPPEGTSFTKMVSVAKGKILVPFTKGKASSAVASLPHITLVHTSERPSGGRRAGIIVHDGSVNACGRIVADGAFTRLFVDWGKHGTRQYISNAAAYIAGGAREEPEPCETESVPASVLAFDYTGAPTFTCCITENDTTTGGFVMVYGDAPYNLTDDDALNDPVSAGLRLAGVASTAVLAGLCGCARDCV